MPYGPSVSRALKQCSALDNEQARLRSERESQEKLNGLQRALKKMTTERSPIGQLIAKTRLKFNQSPDMELMKTMKALRLNFPVQWARVASATVMVFLVLAVNAQKDYAISRIQHDIEFYDIEKEVCGEVGTQGVGLLEVTGVSSGTEGYYLTTFRLVPFTFLNHARYTDYVFYQCGERRLEFPIQFSDYLPVKLKRGDKIRLTYGRE